MDALREFVIPVYSLKSGEHHFDFVVDWSFFKHFDDSPVEQGKFAISVDLEKQQEHWQVNFGISGALDTACDRCLAPIAMPVEGNHWLIVKFDDELTEEADVVYVSREIRNWNIAQYIYEFVLLSIPFTHRYACEDETHPPCDTAVLDRLNIQKSSQSDNPMWDALKQIEKKP